MELLREEFSVYGLRFSPDSRYVAYVSDESGRNEVYVRAFDSSTVSAGGEKWQVSSQGGLGLVQCLRSAMRSRWRRRSWENTLARTCLFMYRGGAPTQAIRQ
jgi:hypothetical protein